MNSILLKRSDTTSNAPTTGEMDLGELAINTFDSKLFAKTSAQTPTIAVWSADKAPIEVTGSRASGAALAALLTALATQGIIIDSTTT